MSGRPHLPTSRTTKESVTAATVRGLDVDVAAAAKKSAVVVQHATYGFARTARAKAPGRTAKMPKPQKRGGCAEIASCLIFAALLVSLAMI